MSDCSLCSRRDFVSGSVLAAVGAFLAACSDGGAPTAPTNVNVTVSPAAYPALASVGGIARVAGGGPAIAMVRTGADTIRAFSMTCPHRGNTININGQGFRCPGHGATFNANGAWTGGQRTSDLFEFNVTSNTTAGTITITS